MTISTIKFDKAKWKGKPLSDRIIYMGTELHVSHPDFVRAMVSIKNGVVNCEQLNSGSGLLILAPTGAGKSYLRQYLSKLWPISEDEWSTKIPVLSFQIPKIVNKARMTRAAISATGLLIPARRDQDPYEQLIQLILKLNTRVIVIDNVHDIPAQRRDGGIFDIGNWIRDLIEDSKTLVVLLGAPSALSLVNLNTQLRRRIASRIEIRYFEVATTTGFKRFERLLKQFDSQLPLSKPICWDESLIKEVHWATFGIMDYLHGLFVEAVRVAVMKGMETITREVFEEALFAQLKDALPGSLNPFSKGGATRALDQPGEPFFNWSDSWTIPATSKRPTNN